MSRIRPSYTSSVPMFLSSHDTHAKTHCMRQSSLPMIASCQRRGTLNSQQDAGSAPSHGESTSDVSASAEAHLQNASSGGATVVVVDDEPAIRTMVAMVLANAHYHVVPVNNAMDAAHYIHQAAGAVDALVTDVVMPVVSGTELAVWMRRVWPHIPVLFMSGFCEPSRLQLSPDDVAHHYLAKPFSLSALTTHVALLIDQRRTGAGHTRHD